MNTVLPQQLSRGNGTIAFETTGISSGIPGLTVRKKSGNPLIR
ncbi:MAG: hypothetical protein PHF57_03830 [Methanoregula sp.]|nr:hypothetical protein [Methanoregula sp.]MDD5023647.1 hypothetical protein [Methanoregula sp.]MDD5187317.1 hypothetical protein [Methanoregula sp.]